MFLEHVSSGEIVQRLDKQNANSVITLFNINYNERSNDVYTITLVNPSISPTFDDSTPGVNKPNEFIIWLDQQKTICLGGFVVNENEQNDVGILVNGNNSKIWYVKGKGFRSVLNRKGISICKANISIKDLIENVVELGGTDYGISNDYTYIQSIDTNDMAKVEFIEMKATEIMDELYDYGVSWYIDENKKVHAWDNTNKEYAFDLAGYTINDKSSLPQNFKMGKNDGHNLANVIKIIGKPKKSPLMQKKIIGTGDVLNGLDYILEHNPYIDNYFVDEWNSFDSNTWLELDTSGNIKPGFDGQGYIFTNQGKLVCWGGTGTIGDISCVKKSYFEYENEGYITSAIKYNNGGMAYVTGLTDGNGSELKNIVLGFKIDSDQIKKIVVDGEDITPDTVVDLNRMLEEDISNLSNDRRSFDVNDATYLSINDTVLILGDNLGIKYVTIEGIAGSTVTINQPIPKDEDLTNAKLYRDPWYYLRILFESDGIKFQVQGEDLGSLGSGDWTTIHETNNIHNIPQYVYELQITNKDLECYFERFVTVPSEEFSFVLDDGTVYSIAPEEYATAAASQVIIHPKDSENNPPRLSFRAPAFSASIDNTLQSLTEIYYYAKSTTHEFKPGDRLIINKEETYIDSHVADAEFDNSGKIILHTDYPLTNIPAYNDQIYALTTMLPENTNGTLSYRYEIDNAFEFRDETSISAYGEIHGEPIEDIKLKNFLDLEIRANAYLNYHANPRVSGSFYFDISKDINEENGFLSSGLNIPKPGQYFTVQSDKKNISTTDVKINSVDIELLSSDSVRCTVKFNKDDYSSIIFEKRLKREIMDMKNRNKMLFQSEKITDSLGLVDSVESVVNNISAHGAIYFNTMTHGYIT